MRTYVQYICVVRSMHTVKWLLVCACMHACVRMHACVHVSV